METVEVHSKSYLVRWVHGDAQTVVSWKIVPEKRSINFGVFVHNEERHAGIQLDKSTGSIKEKLEQSGFRPLSQEGLIRVDGKCVSEGTAEVEKPIMLAFVFDNTFSISQSKHIQFWFHSSPMKQKMTSPVVGTTTSSLPLLPEESQELSSHTKSAVNQNASIAEHTTGVPSKSAVGSTTPSTLASEKFPDIQTSPHEAKTEFPRLDTGGSNTINSSSAKSPATPSLAQTGGKPLHDNSSGVSLRKMSTSSRTGDRRPTISKIQGSDEAVLLHPPARTGTMASISDNDLQISPDGLLVSGYLQKKRRKQFQGFARRYFVLDKSKGLLTYYLNNRSQSLRGVMPVKIVDISSDKKTHQVTIDSGMERWTLKANDANTFRAWHDEIKHLRSSNAQKESDSEGKSLESATNNDVSIAGSAFSSAAAGVNVQSPPVPTKEPLSEKETSTVSKGQSSPQDSSISRLLGHLQRQIALLPDGAHRLNLEQTFGALMAEFKSASHKFNDFARKANPAKLNHHGSSAKLSSSKVETVVELLQKELNSNNFLLVCGFAFIISCFVGFKFTVTFIMVIVVAVAGGLVSFRNYKSHTKQVNDSMSSSSSADAKQAEYDGSISGPEASQSIAESNTTESAGEEPSDSSEYDVSDSDDDEIQSPIGDVTYVPHSSAGTKTQSTQGIEATDDKPKAIERESISLYPLPHDPVERRTNVPSPTEPPPNLMALIKKAKQQGNTGAPITTNEPISQTQYVAELFENCDLLDKAAAAAPKSQQRTILVAVFLVARMSAYRFKERSLRKPFTPLLGETFEMVREDRGIRYVSEKVMHKPEVIATQTESSNWTVHFTSRPHTKMWAKSAQLTDVGTFCVTFPDGESVSFINPEMFIRNILAGERYIEPSGTVSVESSAGTKATVEFKAGGMFSGRSEDVNITCGKLLYDGKWTESINNGSEVIWKAKPATQDSAKHYGWTVFCAQLNEITNIEQSKLPPNDSRMRPDLRLYEKQSDNEKAEKIKLELEQHQRERRAEMEQSNKQHEPFFFKKSKDAQGHYVLYSGKRNYWSVRENQDWDKIPHYFE